MIYEHHIFQTGLFHKLSSCSVLFACEVIENKMEVISQQKIHSYVAFNQSCRPELERVRKK